MNTIKNQLKRAFTIVELVIVIAVIAALAAVLIPTFVNVLNSASESNDTVLVKNINTILSTEETLHGGQASSMSEALEWVEDNGYKVENLTPTSADYDIIWDQEENQFLLVEGSTVVYPADVTLATSNAYRYWYIVNNNSDYTKYSANNCSLYINTSELDSVESNGGIEYASGITSTATVVNATSTDASTSSTEGKSLASTVAAAASNTTSIPQIIIITNGGTLSVTVTGNAEVTHSGKASTVTVVSASNYVVSATVTELNVTSGSITVSSSAIINTITADSNISVTIETGASVTQVAGGATVSGNTSSVNQLGTAASGFTYKDDTKTRSVTSTYVKLENDLTVNNTLYIGKTASTAADVLIDLNGHTLTCTSIEIYFSSLTICDTSAEGTGKIEFTTSQNFCIRIRYCGTLTLNGGTIYCNKDETVSAIKICAQGKDTERYIASFIMNGGAIECVATSDCSSSAIFLMQGYDTSSITSSDFKYTGSKAYAEINGGTITTQGYYCICTNGLSTHGVENIVINGGTLTAYNADVMYLPANGTTTINGGTLQSICGANVNSANSYGCGDGIDASYDTIEIKGGTLYINGGTFYTNGAYSASAQTPCADGTTPAGAAVNVCSKTGYSGNIVVVISGGSFTSVNGSAINVCLAEGTSDDQVRSVSISGGTYSYNSSHYAVECTINGANVTVDTSLGLKTYGI